MASFTSLDFTALWCKLWPFILACALFVGLLLGSAVYLSAEPEVFSWMRGAADCSVSIVSLLRVAVFPLLVAALAVAIGQNRFLALLVPCKAFAFSVSSLGLMSAWGQAGWMMRFLLMFSDICSLWLLVLFALRYGSGQRRLTALAFLGFLAGACLIVAVDVRCILPILASL